MNRTTTLALTTASACTLLGGQALADAMFPYVRAPVRFGLSFAGGDFDGDGDADFVGVTGDIFSGGSDGAWVLLNESGIGFTLSQALSIFDFPGFGPADLGVFDADGDGDLDVLSWQYNEAVVLLNDGAGNLTIIDAGVAAGGNTSYVEIAAGQFNGDTFEDVAIATSEELRIFFSGGDGTLIVGPVFDLGNDERSVVAGDLDGDGDTDLAVESNSSNTLTVVRNDGSGSFTALPAIGGATGHAQAGDVDSDGDVDIVSGDGLFRNDGTGALVYERLPTFARFLIDFNDDGLPDLVTPGTGSVTTSMNSGGVFATPVTQTVPNSPFVHSQNDVKRALDVDGDGRIDIAVLDTDQSGAIDILFNRGDGGFAPALPTFPAPVSGTPVAGDFDGDGDADILIVSFEGAVGFVPNDGSGGFGAGSTMHSGALGADTIRAVDMEGDGDPDVVVVGDDQVVVLVNDGGAVFTPVSSEVSLGSLSSKAVGDINGDAFVDVAGGNMTAINAGDNSFTQGPEQPLFGFLQLGDLDGDGDLDAVGSLAGVTVRKNDGSGVFTPAASPNAPFAASGKPGLGDVDADGDLDLFIGGFKDADGIDVYSIDLFVNNGSGGFSSAPGFFLQRQAVTGEPYFAFSHDFNADGRADVVFPSTGNADIVMSLEGEGGSTVYRSVNFAFEPQAFADFDGDSDLDAVRVENGNIVLYYNNWFTPAPPPAGPDLDGSGLVDSTDLNLVLANFGCTIPDDCTGDTDGDGDTDSTDLNNILSAFGTPG